MRGFLLLIKNNSSFYPFNQALRKAICSGVALGSSTSAVPDV